MQPVVPRLAPHPQQVRIAPAPNAATPLLGAPVSRAQHEAGPSAAATMGTTLRAAAWRFGATCTLGAGAAFALSRYYHDRAPLLLGLPLTAVTALGVTSWRLGREPAPLDLEQGPVAPPAAAMPQGHDAVWVAALAEALCRLYNTTQPAVALAPGPSKQLAHARPKRRVRFPASRLRTHTSGPYQQRLSADARKRSLAGRRAFVEVARPDAPSAASSAGASGVATRSASTPSTAPSEQTLCSAAPQLNWQPSKDAAKCAVSQSVPNLSRPAMPWADAASNRLTQSDAELFGPIAPGAPRLALQLPYTRTQAPAASGLAMSDSAATMRNTDIDIDIDGNGLIMPVPRQDVLATVNQGDSERSSLSELVDALPDASPTFSPLFGEHPSSNSSPRLSPSRSRTP